MKAGKYFHFVSSEGEHYAPVNLINSLENETLEVYMFKYWKIKLYLPKFQNVFHCRSTYLKDSFCSKVVKDLKSMFTGLLLSYFPLEIFNARSFYQGVKTIWMFVLICKIMVLNDKMQRYFNSEEILKQTDISYFRLL